MAQKAAWTTHTSTLVRGTHEFRIVGVPNVSCTITSGDFLAGGHTWSLSCGFDNDGHLASISLELLRYAEEDVVAMANIRIEDTLRRGPAAVWRSDDAYTFPHWDTSGYSRRLELSVPDAFRGREERYVIDDCLTIHCSVDVLREESTPVESIATQSSGSPMTPPGVSRDLGKLLLRDGSSDVTFVVEDAEIKAHKLVLAMRSPVFAAEFRWQTEEGERIRIDDMSASIFRAMLRFIYTDELPIKLSNNVGRACKQKYAARRRKAMALDLLVAADRYDLDRLRSMCENILSEGMDVSYVLPMLMVVHGRHNCRQLEASCIEYLTSDPHIYAAVKATQDYKELKESCSSFLFDITEKVATFNLQRNPSSLAAASSSKIQPQKSTSTYYSRLVVDGVHEFRIPDFFAMQKRFGVGKSIDSCKFQVGGYDWMLKLYPSGRSLLPNNAKGHISLFLCLVTYVQNSTNIKTSLTFRIGDPSGKFPPTTLSVDTCFGNYAREFTYPKFITWESAKSQYLAHDGSLTIRCDVAVTKEKYTSISTSTGTTRVGTTIPVPPSNIVWHLEQLLASEQGSDVTFLVEEREIHAHSLLIAAWSPILYEAVANANNDDHVIRIDNMKAATFNVILHFIYTDELPPLDDLVSSAARDVAVIASDILTAAVRFRLERMKSMMYTSSTHRSNLLRGTLRFDIVGYKVQKAIASGAAVSSVQSGGFQAGGYYWALVCTFGHGTLASITLELLCPVAAEEDVIVALASLRIEDPLARWPAAVWRSDDANAFSMDANSIYGRTWELHVPDAFHGNETRYVRDDRLVIHCTVDVLDDEEDATTAGTISVVPPPTISGDLHEVLLLEEYRELAEMMKKKSTSSSEVMSVLHEFTIPNFCAVQKRHGVDEYISSGTFQVGGYDWKLNVYPSESKDHDDDDEKGKYISLFLELVTDPGTSHVKAFKLFRIYNLSSCRPPTIKLGGETIFTSDTREWGFSEVVTVESAKSHYLRHGSSLAIYCNVVVKEDHTSPDTTRDHTGSSIPVSSSDIIGHLEQLLVSKEVAQVRFLVEESEIIAHGQIIAARSPVLYELVASTVSHNNHVVRIDNMKETVLRTVLHFIYTDELPPMGDIREADDRDDDVIAGDMLAAACRFRLDRMKAMCENLVANNMLEDNAFSMLKLARGCNCSKLEEYCIEFISLQHVAKKVLKMNIDSS